MNFSDGSYPSNTYSEQTHDKYRLETISPYVEWKLDSIGKKLTLNYNYIHLSDDVNQSVRFWLGSPSFRAVGTITAMW